MAGNSCSVRGRYISTCNLINLKFDDFGFKGTKLPPFGMLIFEFMTDDKILDEKYSAGAGLPKFMMFILYIILRNLSPSWISQKVPESPS